jgi:hypothetical protein
MTIELAQIDGEAARMLERLAARMFDEVPSIERVGRFELRERLGAGAMGVVYAAWDPELDRRVAIKLLRDASGTDAGLRLLREAKAMAQLRHPNVIQVYEIGHHDGQIFVAMQVIEGISLRTWLLEQRRTWREIVAVFIEAGRGLAAAHAAGLVHRDVKPANVLLGGEHAYLADFGLSQVVGSDTRLTSTGQWIGTADFMAPEQFEGGEVDARADIYALGCVLYDALTGSVPYQRGTVPKTMIAHLQEEPPRPSEHGAPLGFDRVIARALAKDPEDRYPSAGDLGRAALAAAEGRPVTESERVVARGAAAPVPRREVNGRTAVTNVLGSSETAVTEVVRPPRERTAATQGVAPPPRERTQHKPRETLPLGDRPRRRRRGLPTVVAGLAAVLAVGAAVAALANRSDGVPVAEGEVEDLAQEFADAYAKEDATTLSRLLTRDVERVVPGARQEGRTAVLASYKRQFDDSDTRTFELEDLEVQGGSAGRASGRYVATYKGEPDVTGAIAFNVLRDRGEPRIALISARQDTR